MMTTQHNGLRAGLGLALVLGLMLHLGAQPAWSQFQQNIGTLPADKSISLKYSVTINASPSGTAISNEGTVSGTNFSSASTDDPDTPGMPPNDPTITLLQAPTSNPADLDGDGDVDQDDLGIIVSCFGQTAPLAPPCDAADLAPPPSGDGVINILDISFVGSNFTPP